jgi:geranylgeranyl diphosphate synthase, type III
MKRSCTDTFSGCRNCVPLVNTMGLIFQICDDYLNLSSTTYSKNKGLCEDLTEGKFSFPIIHSIRSDPDNLQLINILKQKTTDEQVKRYAVDYIENTGSFSYTQKVIAQLRDVALQLINEINSKHKGEGDGEMVKAILEKIVELTLEDRGDGKKS